MSNKKNLQELIEKIQNSGELPEEEELSVAVKARVDALEKLHLDVAEVDKEYKKERAALEAKYHVRRQEFYAQRTKIVAGDVEVPLPEGAVADAEEKGVPGFWLRCLANHPAIGDYITEEDIPCLEHLTDITVEYNAEYSSFKLIFHFSENEFFSNTTLEKAYRLDPDVLEDKSPMLMGAVGTEINWKASKNLTVTEIKKKQKAKSGKNKGQTRTITILEPRASFFHYFADVNPDEDKEEEEDEEDEENEENKFKIGIEEDYEIAHSIRTEIICDAVKWFTGEAVPEDQYDFDDEDEEGDEEDDEDDEDEDEEEEEDDDEEEEVDTKKKGKKGGKPAAAPANGEQPECKQN